MKQSKNDYLERLQETALFLSSKFGQKPNAAVILGSGLGEFTNNLTDTITIPYSEIPNFPEATVAGHSGELVYGKINDKAVLAFKGRFHLYEGHELEKVVFPIRVIAQLGIANLFITNASGGINENFVPGDLVLIKDHINLSGRNPLIGPNLDKLGPRFPDMSTAYDNELGNFVLKSAEKNKITVKSGTYFWYTGPSYETPAEIRALKILGADMVGMSTVPEVIAAHHCGLKICGISCITNYASGLAPEKLNHQDVSHVANQMKVPFGQLLVDSISQL